MSPSFKVAAALASYRRVAHGLFAVDETAVIAYSRGPPKPGVEHMTRSRAPVIMRKRHWEVGRNQLRGRYD